MKANDSRFLSKSYGLNTAREWHLIVTKTEMQRFLGNDTNRLSAYPRSSILSTHRNAMCGQVMPRTAIPSSSVLGRASTTAGTRTPTLAFTFLGL
jgi:hypothetical protein